MTRGRKLVITGAVVLVLGAGGAGIAQAVSGDEGGGTTEREESGKQEARDDAGKAGRDEGREGKTGEPEKSVGGSTARRAAAAIKAVGGGNATEVEKDNESGGYEVEVKRSDGGFVDVKLDPVLKVVSVDNED